MEKIIEKIKKLHDKGVSANKLGSLAEAEAFAARVSEMCLEHNLTISEVENFNIKGKNEEEMIYDKYTHSFYENKSEGVDWEITLVNSIARNNFCRILTNDYFRTISFIGEKTNVEVVKYLFDVLRSLLREASKKSYSLELEKVRKEWSIFSVSPRSELVIEKFGVLISKENFTPQTYSGDIYEQQAQYWYLKDPSKFGLIDNRSVYIRSFLLGAAFGINKRLKKQREEQESLNNNVTALVIRKDGKLEEALDKFVPNRKSAQRNPTISSGAGYFAGEKFSSTVNIPKSGLSSTKLTPQLS